MSSHFLFVAKETWGHLRPQLALALNLLHTHPTLYITFLVHICCTDKISSEITSYDASESVQARLKIATVGAVAEGAGYSYPVIQLKEQVPIYFKIQLKAWVVGGEGFDARPSFVLVDHFIFNAIAGWKDTCEEASISPAIPLFVFMPVNIAFHMLYNAPGGIVETMLKKADQFKLENPEEDRLALLDKAFAHTDGRIFKQFGLQPIHDYENIPQFEAAGFPPTVGNLLSEFRNNIQHSQGVVLTFSPDLEPEGLGKKVEEALGRSFIQPGPQLSPKVWAGDFSVGTLKPGEQAALDFLDRAELKYGKKSVLYISFGSFFFPSKRPDLVYTVLQSLVAEEPPVPFLFAMAGAPPAIAAGITEYVATNASGLGMVSSWTPQMKVLSHGATGWFLTHGGSNSTSEAVLNAVPLIFWPVAVDQPCIASQLTLNLKMSYELIQVRNGPSVGKPTYRGITPLGTKEALTAELSDLWKTLRGPQAAEVRERVETKSKIIRQSRENGIAKEGMRRFEEFMN